MSNARTLASTINSSSQIVVPSGGIQFTDATNANIVANDSNLIEQDGYETGSWTPTTPSGSWTITTATYTKIGNVVTCLMFLTATSDVGADDFTGLPFTPNAEGGGAAGYNNQITEVMAVYVQAAGVFNFRQGPNQRGLSNNKTIRACFSYTTNS